MFLDGNHKSLRIRSTPSSHYLVHLLFRCGVLWLDCCSHQIIPKKGCAVLPPCAAIPHSPLIGEILSVGDKETNLYGRTGKKSRKPSVMVASLSFVFWRSRVQISARRTAILTRFSWFSSVPGKCRDSASN
jgi:hypothetical protein